LWIDFPAINIPFRYEVSETHLAQTAAVVPKRVASPKVPPFGPVATGVVRGPVFEYEKRLGEPLFERGAALIPTLDRSPTGWHMAA